MTEKKELPREGSVFNSRHRGADPKRCCSNVSKGFYPDQCSNAIKAMREVVDYSGNKHVRGYCGIHDPVIRAERQAKINAKNQAEWAAQTARYKRKLALERLADAALDAIRRIAAGHNDPRALAEEVLANDPDREEQSS